MTMLRVAVCACLVALTTSCANAGQYRLEQGQGVDVCEAYARNLRAVPAKPGLHWGTCLIPIEQTADELHSPAWHGRRNRVPAPAGVDLGAKVDQYIWRRGVNPAAYLTTDQWPHWHGTPEQLEQGRQGFFRRRDNYNNTPQVLKDWALVDIDNDGAEEPVYHDNRGCIYGGVGSPLIVLTSDYSEIDRTKTDLAMVDPPRPSDAPAFRLAQATDVDARFNLEGRSGEWTLSDDPLLSSRYDIFSYRDRTYITYFSEFPPPGPRPSSMPIHVFLIEKDRKHEVCTYRSVP